MKSQNSNRNFKLLLQPRSASSDSEIYDFIKTISDNLDDGRLEIFQTYLKLLIL